MLEHTTHSLLVGDKAARFAEMAGFAREDLNTSRSEALDAAWRAQAASFSMSSAPVAMYCVHLRSLTGHVATSGPQRCSPRPSSR